MNWNDHSKLEGMHAIFSPSTYSWMNYSNEKARDYYINMKAKEYGTRLHAFAEECILLKQTLPRNGKTLNMYVNDAIGFKMRPEQILFYSENFFGTADTISFRKNYLRIHDLKTGVTPASLHQLECYAALFCLEYGIKPGSLKGIELRIYQNDDILIGNPEADVILPIMDRIVTIDRIIDEVKEEEGYEL